MSLFTGDETRSIPIKKTISGVSAVSGVSGVSGVSAVSGVNGVSGVSSKKVSEEVAFSLRKSNTNLKELEITPPHTPIPKIQQSSGLSSKFSSCSSFDISPIHSGRSTPLQFQMEIEKVEIR